MNYQQTEMQEDEINLRDYWRVVMKYRWSIITLFVIIMISVAIGTFSMEPVYKATTQILIDKENHIIEIMQSGLAYFNDITCV